MPLTDLEHNLVGLITWVPLNWLVKDIMVVIFFPLFLSVLIRISFNNNQNKTKQKLL